MPSVKGPLVYFGSADNEIVYCYNRYTCELVWSKNILHMLALEQPQLGIDILTSRFTVRQSPGIFKLDSGAEGIVFGTPTDRFESVVNGNPYADGIGAWVFALDRFTGDLMWMTEIAPFVGADVLAQLTGSPTIDGEFAYFGTASYANLFTGVNRPCTFIGKLVKIRLTDGVVMWQTRSLPTGYGPGSWCGASFWSRISFDETLNAVFAGTGNLHYHPQSVETCFNQYSSNSSLWSQATLDCHAAAVSTYAHPLAVTSLVSLNRDTGAFIWTYSPQGLVGSNSACSNIGPNSRSGGIAGTGCPGFEGPDWDFGGSVVVAKRETGTIIVAQGKSGIVHALDAVDGSFLWNRDTGFGSVTGGGHWGGSYDISSGLFIAAHSGNADLAPGTGAPLSVYTTLAGGAALCSTGSIHAIDVTTGTVVWQAYDALGRVSINGVGSFPDECWTPDSMTAQLELFKLAWQLQGVNGGPVVNASTTAILAAPCSVGSLGGPPALANSNFAVIHGPQSISGRGIVAVGSMTGNLYFLDSANGECLHDLACPRGGIYGGATIVDNQVLVQCGYGKYVPSWFNVAKDYVTRVFQLA